jgi:hypothetical protein
MNLKIGDLLIQNGNNLGMIIGAFDGQYIVEWYGNDDVTPYKFNYSPFITESFRREYFKFRKWV